MLCTCKFFNIKILSYTILAFFLSILVSCCSVRNEELVRYQNKKTNEICILVLPFSVKEKNGNQYRLSDYSYSVFHFFQYRILSPYASPQEFIEDSRKEVIATLQAAGYQLPSSENVAVKEWSGLLLKFILKADEINRHLCFLYRNRNIICSGLGYLSSYPIPNLSMAVPKMLDSFVDESSRTSE